MTQFSEAVLLSLLLALPSLSVLTNFITNGGFSVQALPASSYLLEGATNWTGYQYETMNLYTTLGYGQYVDLQYNAGINGYMEQYIKLPEDGDYNLSFLQQAKTTTYSNHVMEVYWNGQLIATQIANTTSPTLETFVVAGVQGVNVLKFNEIGSISDGNGMFLDEVKLIRDITSKQGVNSTTTQSGSSQVPSFISSSSPITSLTFDILPAISSTPFNHASGFSFFYFLAEDLWLYYYDIIEHEDILEVVFNTTTTIELMKMAILDRFLGWNNFSSNLPLSDYLPYTRQRFMEVENSSSVLIKAVFPFFVYSIPSNILLCLLLRLLFLLLRQYRVSKFLRRFYFLKTALLQTMLEGNVIYFVYVCFGHLATAFHFCLADKLSLVFTVLFLWVIFVFTFAFYPLVGRYLKKNANHFLGPINNCISGHFFLTIKYLARNFCRGTAFYFLNCCYLQQLTLLSAIQLIIIILIFFIGPAKMLFKTKIVYMYFLFQHFLLTVLNISMYLSEVLSSAKPTSLLVQTIVIYLLIGLTAIIAISQILPRRWLETRVTKSNIAKTSKKKKEISGLNKNEREPELRLKFRSSSTLKKSKPSSKLKVVKTQKQVKNKAKQTARIQRLVVFALIQNSSQNKQR